MTGDAFSNLDDPKRIYQSHLDALSDAILSRNFSAYIRRMSVPHTLYTENTKHVLRSKDEMAETFYALHASLKSQRVTQYLTIAKQATFKAEDFICGEHETHILSGGQRIVSPYPSRVRLEKIGLDWVETASSLAITNIHGARGIPRVSENPTMRPLPGRDQLRA